MPIPRWKTYFWGWPKKIYPEGGPKRLFSGGPDQPDLPHLGGEPSPRGCLVQKQYQTAGDDDDDDDDNDDDDDDDDLYDDDADGDI